MGGIVADDIGNDQCQSPRAIDRLRQSSTRETGEMLAHGVDVVDGCTGVQQRLGHLAQFLQRDAFDRRGEQAGAAARNQRQQQVVRPQLAGLLQHAQGGRFATPVRQWMAGLYHFNTADFVALCGQAVLIAGHHQAGQGGVGRPVRFHGSGHAGGSFAAAHHQGAAARGRGQMGRQDAGRIGCSDGSVKRSQ